MPKSQIIAALSTITPRPTDEAAVASAKVATHPPAKQKYQYFLRTAGAYLYSCFGCTRWTSPAPIRKQTAPIAVVHTPISVAADSKKLLEVACAIAPGM